MFYKQLVHRLLDLESLWVTENDHVKYHISSSFFFKTGV